MSRHSQSCSFAGPVVIIIAGIVLLLVNAGADIPFSEIFRSGWPSVIIAVGIAHLARAFGKGGEAGRRRLFSGALITTVGALFLLQQVADIPFSMTWPALLVVGGSMALLRGISAPGGSRI